MTIDDAIMLAARPFNLELGVDLTLVRAIPRVLAARRNR